VVFFEFFERGSLSEVRGIHREDTERERERERREGDIERREGYIERRK
jgi:hypothetical protein